MPTRVLEEAKTSLDSLKMPHSIDNLPANGIKDELEYSML
jgi:hypothetical protein